MRLFSFGGYGSALAALALVVFGAYDSYPSADRHSDKRPHRCETDPDGLMKSSFLQVLSGITANFVRLRKSSPLTVDANQVNSSVYFNLEIISGLKSNIEA